MYNIVDHVRLRPKLVILDQRRLPLHREYLVLATEGQMMETAPETVWEFAGD